MMGMSHLLELIGISPALKTINGHYSSLIQNGEWIVCLPLLLCLFGHVFKIRKRFVLVGATLHGLGATAMLLACFSTTKVYFLLSCFAWVLFFLPTLLLLCIMSLPLEEFLNLFWRREMKLYGWTNALMYIGYGVLHFSNISQGMTFESQRIFSVVFDLLCVIFVFVISFKEQLKGQESSLEVKLGDMEKRNASQKLFLRFVFHEVRVPFHSLLLGLEHLATQLNSEKHQSLMTMLMQAAESMQRTINDVLLLSRLEDGKLELETIPFSLADMARNTLSTFKMMAQEKQVTLTLQVDPSLPRLLLGDQHRISEILANLVSNGLKFSKENQNLYVFVNVLDKSHHNCYFQIKVQDEGIGMSVEDQKQLFMPYSQIRPGETQAGKGSGLGLSIVKLIVGLYGGSISVLSEVGKGSTFFVSMALPIVPTSPRLDSARLSSSFSEPRFLIDSPGATFDGPTRMQQTQIMLPENEESMLEDREMLSMSLAEKSFPEFTETRLLANKRMNKIVPYDSKFSRTPMDPMYEGSFSPSQESKSSLTPLSRHEPTKMVSFFEQSLEKKSDCSGSPMLSHDSNMYQCYITALVVDDSHLNRKLTRLVLEQEGIAVDEACNGEEAVRMVNDKKYSIIYMDNQMPVMDGVEATRQITKKHNCVVIGLTGNSLDEDVTVFLQAGAKEVLTKPCKREKLLSVLTFIAV